MIYHRLVYQYLVLVSAGSSNKSGRRLPVLLSLTGLLEERSKTYINALV